MQTLAGRCKQVQGLSSRARDFASVTSTLFESCVVILSRLDSTTGNASAAFSRNGAMVESG